MGHICLITGGARSGKSRFAEARIEALPGPWTYIATAEAGDAEMAARIAEHQSRHGSGWRTRDAALDLPTALQAVSEGALLIDCLTLWLSNLMAADRSLGEARAALCTGLQRCRIPVIIVTNEVGQGVVPANPLARGFRDGAGRLNQAVAQIADEVIMMVAGLPLTVKTP